MKKPKAFPPLADGQSCIFERKRRQEQKERGLREIAMLTSLCIPKCKQSNVSRILFLLFLQLAKLGGRAAEYQHGGPTERPSIRPRIPDAKITSIDNWLC